MDRIRARAIVSFFPLLIGEKKRTLILYTVLAIATMSLAEAVSAEDLIVDGGGENIDIGDVSISRDKSNLIVKFEMNTDPRGSDWCMTETHLHITDDLNAIPRTNNGDPIPEKFDHNRKNSPCVTESTHTVSLNWTNGTVLYVAAQVSVRLPESGELVSNGGFETPDCGSTCVYSATSEVFGWTATPIADPWIGLELHDHPWAWTPYEGNQYAELDSWNSVKISQDLTTGSWNRCRLQYAWSPRPDHSNNELQVNWAGSRVAGYTENGGVGYGGGYTDWHLESHVLIPDPDGMTTLEYNETGKSDYRGMFLDGISVICEDRLASAWGDGNTFRGENWATFFTYTIIN